MSENIIDFDSRRELREPGKCPHCKSTEIAAIIYGYPSPELVNSDDDSLVLGGCVIGSDSAEWHCNQCGKDFGHVGG